MKLPSKAKLAKDCFLAMCQHIALSYTEADLELVFSNIITPEVFVRNSILEGIDAEFDLTGQSTFSSEIWIATFDNDEHSRELAVTIWDDNNFQVVEDATTHLLPFFGNKNAGLRFSIARAFAAAVEVLIPQVPTILERAIEQLIDLYHVKENPPPPKLDRFGLPIKSTMDNKDTWEERSTIALTLGFLAPLLSSKNIERVFEFLVSERALGDKEPLVRQELQDSGKEIINLHGKENVEVLIPIFEVNLAAKDERSKTQNNIKESVIILYGSLARHLDIKDDRLEIIVDRLLKTLDTPSISVQYAIAECIAPLVKSFESKVPQQLDLLFTKLFEGKTLPIRKGAAYGIAGLVKGYGIKALRTFDIIRTLSDAADDKKDPHRREGVSYAFECFSRCLGRFFEPYVIEILPILLKSLGDPVPEVRDATNEAAKQIMKTTTSFGVKKLIPLAISNLDEIAWRSKKGSVELLGSMAYLDPTQLSASLSTIVPEIVGVLNDTHKEVRKAGEQSLKRFGEVIRNPEIQAIVPDLINAIGDPTKYTDDALDKLIKTQFVHYIDGPSLALIIHVIHRGMKERSAATKKKACQIVGNMSILVDSKDLKPYLTELVQELEVSMVDPVPATRSTAARALGSLVEKLGEDQFPDLIPHLLDTLQDETKLGDRLGSAQALSEVISGLGINKLEELLPIILSSASSPRNHIRAGFMPLLLFLPVCFGTQFSPYLTKIIPPILNGLADIDEDIRDTALRAGRLIVKNYAKKAVDILLPELENGLSDSNYRIRLSSVELTGDLLFQITGISGKNELTEEQNEFSGEVNRNLLEVLGQERRDRVLSLLFVCRSDVAGIVRNASVDIWKALVANTPKTVKEVLPTLTTIIVKKLASDDDVQRTIGAQTLGEMVRRVGANALAQILPTLEETLASGDTDSKQGICIAVTELIKSAQRDALVEYQDEFITIVRDSLIDSSNGVREAAARAFEALQEALGKVVIDEIIPHLLSLLERPDSDSQNALLALQDIMETKADIVFPILLPSLLTAPIDTFKANALASLASVAGSALYKRLSIIINTLVNAMVEFIDNEAIPEAFDKILLAIDEEEGVHPLMQQLLSLVKHEDAAKRAVVYGRLGNFFTNTTIDYSIYLQDMVSQFILSLDDKTPAVVKGTFDALSALVKSQSKESLEKLVKPARQALELTGVKGEPLAAFALPKGPNCILPIFLHGLMYGTSDQREASALAIADIIDKTPADNLKPFATTMTGPLIRVVGEKVSSDIKAAILVALNSLLIKIPQFLRPFIPQLQRTFVRSLSDSANEKLRSQAVKALSTLIEFQPRVDSLVTELVSGAKSSGDSGVKTSMLKAMLEVVVKAGKNMNATSKTAIMTLVEDEITIVDDKSAVSYAKLVGSLAKILNLEEAKHILKNKILDKPNNTNDKFSILSVNSFLRYSPEHIFNAGLLDEIVEFIVASSNSSQSYISDNATVAMGKLLLLHDEVESPVSKAVSDTTDSLPKFTISDEQAQLLVTQLATTTLSPLSNSTDTRRLSLVVIRTVARFKYQQFISPYLDVLVPSVFSCLRDPVIPIKLAAEKAYLAVFDLVDDSESKVFNGWFEGKQEFVTVTGTSIVARSIGDYTRRVASRLAGVERERIVAGGDAETMFSDRYEDEAEVWAIGGV
ncbi:armadillo-type protein [Scheffersomyces amazonensis]|uniref:armadillo-type protein n=1 Tax=Scheffersomyces amazonensis TaxID=1078765 RepID=UPI00315D0C38